MPVKRCPLLLAPLVLLCVAAPASAASPVRRDDAAQQQQVDRQMQAVSALVMRGDADSLAAAAALSFRHATSPSALQLAVRAGELQPQNAAIGWLHLQLCVATTGCDFRDTATVLRWVDADNGASWLPALSLASRDKDSMQMDRVIAAMARTARFDLYSNRLVVVLIDALKKARPELPRNFAAGDAARFDLISNIVDALLPSFAPLVDACRSAAAGAARRDSCLRLAQTMQNGDTVVAQMTGFAIEKRLLPPDGRDARALNERRHLLEVRLTAATESDAVAAPWLEGARARSRLAKMRALPREEDVCIAILRDQRKSIAVTENHP